MNANDILNAMIFGGGGSSGGGSSSTNVEDMTTTDGVLDAGKVLAVGDDGKITPVTLGVGEGEIAVDAELLIEGAAADAKATGDSLAAKADASTTYTKTQVDSAIASVNESLQNMQNATDGDVGKALKVKTVANGKVTEWEFGATGGGTIDNTAIGSSITFSAIAGEANAASVTMEADIPDTSAATPTNPVSITGITSETITVNGTDKVITFSNPIGKGAWDVLTGTVSDERPIVEFTSDMITGTGTVGDMKTIKFSVGDIDLAPAESGIIACSHYKIFTTSTDVKPYLRYYANTSSWWIYDDAITTDMTTQEAKDYIDSLHIKLIVNPVEPIEFSESPETIALAEGENTVAVSTGTMSLTYPVDTKDYVDAEVAEVAEVANNAASTANGYNSRITVLETLTDEVYKFETVTGSNTGTGAAGAGSTIHWGFFLDIDEDVSKCWSVTVTPTFSATTGSYTATRWKKTSGALEGGDTLTLVSSTTKTVGESVTFEKVGVNEFISFNISCKRTVAENGGKLLRLGRVNPSTGVYTSFSGYLSGSYTLVEYKAIKSDAMPLFGKKITLIGDSITEKTGRAAVTHGQYLDRWTGCNVQNLGVSSTGFSTTNKYKSRISSISADVDIIGVAASFNDMRNSVGTASDTASDETVCGYANEFFDLLLTSFPAASIVCYSEGAWESYRPGVEKSDTYMTEMEKICKSKGIAWDCSLYKGCALRPWIEANRNVYYVGEEGQYEGVVDNTHPNSAGQKIIANYLRCLFEKYLTGLE